MALLFTRLATFLVGSTEIGIEGIEGFVGSCICCLYVAASSNTRGTEGFDWDCGVKVLGFVCAWCLTPIHKLDALLCIVGILRDTNIGTGAGAVVWLALAREAASESQLLAAGGIAFIASDDDEDADAEDGAKASRRLCSDSDDDDETGRGS